MIYRFFDFEVFPHWWCCSFGDLPEGVTDIDENIKAAFRYVNSDMEDARDRIVAEMFEKVCKVGYNIKGYDLQIANCIYQGFTCEQIKYVSDLIIVKNKMPSTKEEYRLAPFRNKRLKIDLYQDLLDDSDGTLKDKESALGLDIHESDVPFDKEDLTDEDKADVKDYNFHDVYSAMKIFCTVDYQNYINAKLICGSRFDIPIEKVYKSTNPTLVGLILKAKKQDFDDEERVDIQLPECIEPYCFKNCDKTVLKHLLLNKSSLTLKLFDNRLTVGDGGMHSTYPGHWTAAEQARREDRKILYVESDDEYMLVNVDAKSYYPSLMIFFRLLSRAVERPDIYKLIFDERLRLSDLDQKTLEEIGLIGAYKLVLNSTSGAQDNEYLPMYDKYNTSKMRRVGQIYLLTLALLLSEFAKIIQTNTDSILIYVKRKLFPRLQNLADEWMHLSGIRLEFDYVDKIWQVNVNNYVLVKEGGKVKNKGGWLNTTTRKAGTVKMSPMKNFVCAKAVVDYLTKGKDIVKSLVSNNNVADFITSCKCGSTFAGVVHRMSDGYEVPTNKANRVIACKDEKFGKVYKYKIDEKGDRHYQMMPDIPDHCMLMNNSLDSYKFEDLKPHIDYSYYLLECEDLLHYQFYHLCGDELIRTYQFNYFD